MAAGASTTGAGMVAGASTTGAGTVAGAGTVIMETIFTTETDVGITHITVMRLTIAEEGITIETG